MIYMFLSNNPSSGEINSSNLPCFEFELVVQEKMSLKDISYLELWQPICSVERNHLCNFGRRHHEEQFCEIILNLDQLSGGDVVKRYF